MKQYVTVLHAAIFTLRMMVIEMIEYRYLLWFLSNSSVVVLFLDNCPGPKWKNVKAVFTLVAVSVWMSWQVNGWEQQQSPLKRRCTVHIISKALLSMIVLDGGQLQGLEALALREWSPSACSFLSLSYGSIHPTSACEIKSIHVPRECAKKTF